MAPRKCHCKPGEAWPLAALACRYGARMVPEGDKAPTSVPEIIISPFINLHHGVEVPACNRGQSIRVATSLPWEPKTDHLVRVTLLDTPTRRQKPYAIAHSIQ
ncbi:hypothetical protein FALCPG4_014207 [Fusarium falciforme]